MIDKDNQHNNFEVSMIKGLNGQVAGKLNVTLGELLINTLS
jgi:hypothetical protein